MAVKGTILRAAGKVSVFGFLERIPVWANLPYPIKGTLLRAAKAGLSAAIAIVLAAATAGTLFPADWGPAIALVLIPIIQAADKYIREWNIDEELKASDAKIAVVPQDTPEVEAGDATATETEGQGKVEADVSADAPRDNVDDEF